MSNRTYVKSFHQFIKEDLNSDEDEVSAAVEYAKDLMHSEGYSQEDAANYAAQEFDGADYDSVIQGLNIDEGKPDAE